MINFNSFEYDLSLIFQLDRISNFIWTTFSPSDNGLFFIFYFFGFYNIFYSKIVLLNHIFNLLTSLKLTIHDN